MDINTMPDKKLEEMREKYTEKNERYKHFVNEETERTTTILNDINTEIKNREEFRKQLNEIFLTK
jgi:hypothetical protein